MILMNESVLKYASMGEKNGPPSHSVYRNKFAYRWNIISGVE